MSASEIIDKFGGARSLAELLGLTESAVRNWPGRGIPRSKELDLLRLARDRGVSLSEEELLSTTKRGNGS